MGIAHVSDLIAHPLRMVRGPPEWLPVVPWTEGLLPIIVRAMASAFQRRIEANVRELGGDERVFEWVREGWTMKRIGAAMGCSRDYVYRWLEWEEGRRARFDEARKASAPNILEDADEMVEEELSSGEEISGPRASLLRERVGLARYRAEAFERGSLNKTERGVEINLSIGDLHLAALQAHGSRALPSPEPEVLEAEVVEDA